jgi:Flp pilus assembly protein TadG
VTSARGRRPAGSAGAAVIDFVGVMGLLLLLFLVVLQLGLVLHMRNVLVSAAQEGARHDANADVLDLREGRAVTEAAVAQALSGRAAADVTVADPTLVPVGDGLQAVEVTIRAKVPLVLLMPDIHLTVRGHALREGP